MSLVRTAAAALLLVLSGCPPYHTVPQNNEPEPGEGDIWADAGWSRHHHAKSSKYDADCPQRMVPLCGRDNQVCSVGKDGCEVCSCVEGQAPPPRGAGRQDPHGAEAPWDVHR